MYYTHVILLLYQSAENFDVTRLLFYAQYYTMLILKILKKPNIILRYFWSINKPETNTIKEISLYTIQTTIYIFYEQRIGHFFNVKI